MIRHRDQEIQGLEVINIRDIPFGQVKKEFYEFTIEKDRVKNDEIADALRLGMGLVDES